MIWGGQDWIQGQVVLQEHDSHGALLKQKQNDDILRRLLNNAAELWGLSRGAAHSHPGRGARGGQGHAAAWLGVPVTRGWVSLSSMDDSPCRPRVAVPITTATPVPPDPCALSGQWQWVAVPCVGHLPAWCWWLEHIPAPWLLKLTPLLPNPSLQPGIFHLKAA